MPSDYLYVSTLEKSGVVPGFSGSREEDFMYIIITGELKGTGPAPGLDNLLVGTASVHTLDRLNKSNDLQKKKT